MSKDKKSRLSHSLMSALESSSNKQIGAEGKPEDGRREPSIEAFEKADSQATVAVAEKVSEIKPVKREEKEDVPEIQDIENITLELDEPLKIELKEEGRKPAKVKKEKSNNSGRIANLVAMILSVGAIITTVYIGIKLDNFETLATQTTVKFEEKVEGLDSQNEILFTKMGEVGGVLENHIGLIQTTNISLEELKQEFSKLNAEVSEFKKVLVKNSQMIAGQSNDIGNLQVHVKEIKSQQLKVQRIAKTKPVPVKQAVRKAPPQDPTKLEGSIISSIDVWGKRTYVMLKESRGSESFWVPVAEGDRYKGWTLKSASGTKAVFIKGGKTRNLEIQE